MLTSRPRGRRGAARRADYRRLADHRYLPATKADLLHRLGRDREAAGAYRVALALAGNAAERDFLAARLEATEPAP